MSQDCIQHVTDISEYQNLISKRNCVVKFTATWCGPCKRIGPKFTKLAQEYAPNIKVLEIDIDEAQEITNFEDVKSIPLFLFYNNGRKLDNLTLRGCNDSMLESCFQQFNTHIITNPEIKLDISYLVSDNIQESDDDEITDEELEERPLTAFSPELTNTDFIEKTLPEDLVKT